MRHGGPTSQRVVGVPFDLAVDVLVEHAADVVTAAADAAREAAGGGQDWRVTWLQVQPLGSTDARLPVRVDLPTGRLTGALRLERLALSPPIVRVSVRLGPRPQRCRSASFRRLLDAAVDATVHELADGLRARRQHTDDDLQGLTAPMTEGLTT